MPEGNSTDEVRIVLEINAELRYQAAVDEFFRNAFSRDSRTALHDIPSRLQLIISEAFTNVARHAYRDLPPGLVRIEVHIQNGLLRVSITDRGHSFDPASVPLPQAHEGQIGGYGLFIITSQVDRHSYATDNGTNTMMLEMDLE